MPLTLPVRTTPVLYQSATRTALADLLDAAWDRHPADWVAQQWLWRGRHEVWMPGTLRLCTMDGRETRHRVARILAADAPLQTAIRCELARMVALHPVVHEPVIHYFRDGIGILRPGLVAGVTDWRRRDLLAATCLLCDRAETPAAAIARHDAHTALLRKWGDVLVDRDRALGALRLPRVDALLPRASGSPAGQMA